MSLLEDVFLEDEAGEAQELERVIEGDEFNERPARSSDDSSDSSEKEDEAEEDKRRVDPTSAKPKRVSRNPRVLLNPARLMGPRGIQVIPDHFKDFKFKGKGHEKEDLDLVLKKLEHWAYRLFPKFQFEDCLKKIETLGKKRPVMVHLSKIRSDQYISDDVVVQKDSSDDELPQPPQEEDEFDKLLQQQIELARATPAPGSEKKAFGTPRVDTPSFLMPKATSSPSISEEQKERMLRNRRMAEERRLARLKQAEQNISIINEDPSEVENQDNSVIEHNDRVLEKGPVISPQNERKKQNRSNIIDSSDEEEVVLNESITVDVHDTRHNIDDTEEQSRSAKKHNKTNVMNSDEEIAKDIDNENGEEINESIKKRKPNVIDSEEETDDLPVGLSNVINSDEEISKDIDDENDEENNESTKKLKPNVIDSEEESDELPVGLSTDNEKADNLDPKSKEDSSDKVMTVEESDDLPVGLSTDNEKADNLDANSTKDPSDVMTVDEETTVSEVNKHNDKDSQNEIEENTLQNKIQIDCDAHSKKTNQNKDLDFNAETVSKDILDDITEESSTNSKNVTENAIVTKDDNISTNKENVDNNIDSELMDVDFDEDF